MNTGKTIALAIQIFVGKVMCFLFNTLFRFIIAFLSRLDHLLISWTQSPSTVILEPKKKSVATPPFPLGVMKSRTRLSDFTFTFHFHALKKEMATLSSVLAWRIPGTGEPGGLPSMGSHRVGHD